MPKTHIVKQHTRKTKTGVTVVKQHTAANAIQMSRVSAYYYAKGKPLTKMRQKVFDRINDAYGKANLRRTREAGQRQMYKKIVKGPREDRITTILELRNRKAAAKLILGKRR